VLLLLFCFVFLFQNLIYSLSVEFNNEELNSFCAIVSLSANRTVSFSGSMTVLLNVLFVRYFARSWSALVGLFTVRYNM
jgi:hypothetical protein